MGMNDNELTSSPKTSYPALDLSAKQTGLSIFPQDFFWWHKVEEHDDIKQLLMDAIDDDLEKHKTTYLIYNNWDCEIASSYHNGKGTVSTVLIDTKVTNIFLEILWKYFSLMLDCIHEEILRGISMPSRASLSDIWFNRYDAGHWQEVHDHTGTWFSGIYFLDVPQENDGPSFFTQQSKLYANKKTASAGSILKIKNVEGNIVFFPSELAHYVNSTLDTRTTISFNLNCEP